MRNIFLLAFLSSNLVFAFSKKTPSTKPDTSSSSSSASSSVSTTDDVREKILSYVANSACAKKVWKDRGNMPLGFLQGMALTFYKNKNQVTRPLGASDKDALRYYGISDISKASEYAFLAGLSMRESTGRHCVGRDASASNTDANTCEAGAFQYSYNSRTADSALVPLYTKYKRIKEAMDTETFVVDGCERELFAKKVTCKPSDWKNYGTGEGVVFQKLSKECPAFSVEYAAILVRTLRKHFGPINRKEVEYSTACVSMFKEIAKL